MGKLAHTLDIPAVVAGRDASTGRQHMTNMTKTFRVDFHYGTVNGKPGPTITNHAVAANAIDAIREARKLVRPCLISGRDTLTITSTFVTKV